MEHVYASHEACRTFQCSHFPIVGKMAARCAKRGPTDYSISNYLYPFDSNG